MSRLAKLFHLGAALLMWAGAAVASDPPCPSPLDVLKLGESAPVRASATAPALGDDFAATLTIRQGKQGGYLLSSGTETAKMPDVARVLAMAKAEAKEDMPVLIRLDGFSEEKAEAFISTARLQLAAYDRDVAVAMATGEDPNLVRTFALRKTKELREPSLPVSVKVDPANIITAGKHQGWYSSAIRIVHGAAEFVILVISKSKAVAAEFATAIQVALGTASGHDLTVAQLLARTKRELVRKHGLKRDELEVAIRGQLGTIQFGSRQEAMSVCTRS